MPTTTRDRSHFGGLFATVDREKQGFPLKHTEVNAKIAGNLSRVEVIQTFENPFTIPLEAVYVFPLPDEAAVDNMEIKIGDRLIKGTIKKREEAQKIYEQAKQEGRTAGLLEQERDNIFTQSLANIQPGEQIDVIIRYTDSLKFSGGDYEFVFPMVVGPRYIPGTPIEDSQDTDQVPDASRITPLMVPENTRSGHDISVQIQIDAGLPIFDLRSSSHQIHRSQDGQMIKVELAKEDQIPNKDFILHYQVAGDKTQATVLTQTDERGGHFAVYFIPALQYKTHEIVPKDVVFLMDTSGSQMGPPLAQSKELMRRFIHGLNPNDTFTIIDFSSTTKQLSPTPLTNTSQNRTQAIQYINQLQANGGTELLNGIRVVLNFPEAQDGRLRSVVLLTDGYIGNDNAVLAEVERELKKGNRLYSFGVGSSVNRFLLNRIAEVGRGTVQIVRHDEKSDEIVEKFFGEINNPVLTNIEGKWEGTGDPPEIYPVAIPDLFAEQPLVLFGRKKDRSAGVLQVTGIAAGGERYEQFFEINFEETGNVAIAQLWGRQRIKHLMNQMFGYETKSGVQEVTETALTYQLLSQYTAFVAVSEEVRVDPEGNRISVEVPVEMPEGVSYEGIFGAGEADEDICRGITRYSAMNLTGSSPVLRSISVQAMGKARSPHAPSPTSADTKGTFASFLAPLSKAAENLYSKIEASFLGSEEENDSDADSDQELAEQQPQLSGNPHLEIISITSLPSSAIDSLTKHLQNLHFLSGLSGEIVFELSIKNHRVVRLMVDDETSTLKDTAVIELLKRSLQSWRVNHSPTGTVRIHLRIVS